MYGTNEVRNRGDYESGHYKVQDIFSTIQGEGPFAGLPAVFVRFAGCNLRCHFCDTDFESAWNKPTMTALEILEQCRAYYAPGKGCPMLMVLTGGEPFLQDLVPLLSAFFEAGIHVQIETAGTLWQEGIEGFQYARPYLVSAASWQDTAYSIVVSPKTPIVHPQIARRAIAWKYIVARGEVDEEDGLPNVSTQKPPLGQIRQPMRLARTSKHELVYVQPMDVPDEEQRLKNVEAAVESCMAHGYRLSLQLHKIVGLP